MDEMANGVNETTEEDLSRAEENGDSDIPGSSNLEADDVDSALIEKVKGDAIGSTLYSERFVLSTLMRLTAGLDKPLSEDEDYEKDLCTLWDQTVETDVVKFLLEYNCLELFSNALNDEDFRLTEILVGIIGNMCTLAETRHALETSPEITCALISLINSTDTLVLVQLMRLFQAMLVFENSGDELIWFQYFSSVENFVEKFAFVLAQSTSNTLLKHSFDALYAICAKFAVIEIRPEGGQTNFIDMFVTPVLISSMIEAFRQVNGNSDEEGEEDATSTPTENVVKFTSLFLDVNVILSQYGEKSMVAYSEKLDDILDCLSRILIPLCQPIFLFPVCSVHQGVIENLSDILQALDYPFHRKIWRRLLLIYNLLETSKKTKNSNKKSTSVWNDEEHDSEDDAEKVDIDDLQHTLLECLVRISRKSDKLDEVMLEVGNKHIKDFGNIIRNRKENTDDIEGLNSLRNLINNFLGTRENRR